MQGSAPPPGAPGGGAGGEKGKQLFQPPKKEDGDEKKGPYLHLPRHSAGWLLFIGAIFMFCSLAAPWWSWSMSTTTQAVTYYFFIWGVVCVGPSCPGYSSNPLNGPTSPNFASGSFYANIGDLYATAAAMVVIAALFGVVAAAIMFRVARGYSEYAKALDRATLLAYLAVAVGLSVPIMISLAQPASMRADYSFPINLAPSPAGSFYGSLGPGTYNHVAYSSMNWGPTFSWFLCVFGSVFFFGGGLVPHVTRHEPATRGDLIRRGLLKLQQPMRRPLPAGVRAAGLPAPAPMGAGPPRAYAPPAYRPQVYSNYGPGYQSLSPGVGWARPVPAAGYPRPPAALPPGRPGAVSPPAALPVPTYRPPPTVAPAVARPATPPSTPSPVAYRPAPMAVPAAQAPARPAPPKVAPLGNRMCPTCNIYVAPPALRCTKCGGLLPR